MSTPSYLNVRLQKDNGVSKPVGNLLHAAIATRQDIAQAVGLVTKFCSNPSKSHLTAAKRILRYLKGTIFLCLNYMNCANGDLSGYSDADRASNVDDDHFRKRDFTSRWPGSSELVKKKPTVALSLLWRCQLRKRSMWPSVLPLSKQSGYVSSDFNS